MTNLEFVQGWFERGQKEDSGSVFQFFCYFVAFNFLYDHYQGYDRGKVSQLVNQEIIPLYSDNKASIILEDGDAFFNPPEDCFRYERPVEQLKKDDPLEKVFWDIYQVRCNLFHGSKAMNTKRDHTLVRTSAKVLEDFLYKWIKTNGGECDG